MLTVVLSVLGDVDDLRLRVYVVLHSVGLHEMYPANDVHFGCFLGLIIVLCRHVDLQSQGFCSPCCSSGAMDASFTSKLNTKVNVRWH